MSPSLLPTPRVVDGPLEFLWADNRDVVSWSKAEDQEGSSPYWKKEMKVARRSSTNFCTIVILQWRHDLPLDSEPDPSGILLFSTIPLLPVFSEFLSPIFCAP